MLTACMMDRRFAIVTFFLLLGSWYQEAVDGNGLVGRCSGIHYLVDTLTDIAGAARGKAAALMRLLGSIV